MSPDTAAGGPRSSGMPTLGLGTWENTDPEQCADSVATALEVGYRHVDTAQIYGNEDAVGDGLERAAVPREDVFLATKVWIDNLAPADVHETTRESLARLGVESVDLLYVHWPARTYDPEATLSAFAELREEGLIDRIGVSNFEPENLERAVEVLGEAPFANQVECHPFCQQQRLREVCAEHGMEFVAYSPLARGAVFDDPTIGEIADAHDVSPAQVSLAWLRAKGLTAIPKATSAAHIRDNWASMELELQPTEIERIDAIEREDRRVDPGFAPW